MAKPQPCVAELAHEIARCRVCIDTPLGKPLPHAPRAVFRPSATARIVICGQAPGTRVHASGIPFTDRSGDRLRAWMGVTPEVFYDTTRVAIIPMGFCFPGQDAKGGDLPPRRECAAVWHDQLFRLMPQLDLFLLIGLPALRWHVADRVRGTLTETVMAWREFLAPGATRTHQRVTTLPMPHPSWRNIGWLKAHPWFEADLLPVLREEVARRL